MRLFHWTTFLLLLVVYIASQGLLLGIVNHYFGLYAGMMLSAGFPLIIIVYCLLWVWKWNKGDANFF